MKHFNENKLTYPKKLNFFYQILTRFKNKHFAIT